ncbi:mannitol dehydrogenase [Sphingomonas spermidinifaciens]|uniref:Mannitol dehydrogenase n=1 Tax=Sphingomonas spermidinifaciens TaxID=1141889 RepID=A0A2A4B025_9SPHN|nr:mannitol dehydrogenase family protein [Sphingomonas spermidinifaciens]PCD02543.1 mannitol dehydrogenase [Sphingomonas spermidinifaciens]
MTRLTEAALGSLPAAVGRPRYDRAALRTGIVHFGPGAFHRAHQLPVYDALNAAEPRWGVVGVSLNSRSVAEALNPQGGLYTLALLDAAPSFEVVGALRRVLAAGEGAAILEAIAAADTRIVSSTVTEKGYCLTADGSLDMGHPAIVHDRVGEGAPQSLVGWLVAGLAARRAAGAGGLTVLSCDNLADNGAKLGRAVAALAATRGDDLAAWIEGEVRFPSTMVDAITPATDDALRERVREVAGVDDAWPIQRERFWQWVVEDDFAPGARPDLAATGVTLTHDVRGYELAKLRLLNGAHSSLAYLGIERGHGVVAEAMRDAALAGFVERLMREDIAPLLTAPVGLDVSGYIAAILERFSNPAIRHQLIQIAADGSQKLPYRLLDTVRAARAGGRSIERLAMPIAAWLRFVERGEGVADPLAAKLVGRPAREVLGLREVFGELVDDAVFVETVLAAKPL